MIHTPGTREQKGQGTSQECWDFGPVFVFDSDPRGEGPLRSLIERPFGEAPRGTNLGPSPEDEGSPEDR